MSKSLIYLATPYSHPNRAVRVQRFKIANQVAAELMKKGLHIFSPISHTHPIAEEGGLPLDWQFWESYDRAILAACRELWVLRQEGWETSKGVRAEIAIAEELSIPVEYTDVTVLSLSKRKKPLGS